MIGLFSASNSPVKFSNLSSILSAILPRLAPTAALRPPVANACSGSCPYIIAVVADCVPPLIPAWTAASTVEFNPALAIFGLTYVELNSPTFPVA